MALFCMAFFRPASMVDVSIPFFSQFARRSTDWSNDRPMSSRAVLFCMSCWESVSTDTPLSCPALVSMSSMSPAFSVSTPHAAIMDCTLSIEVETSVSFSSANLMNLTDRSSRASPVRPNRVLTSPIAVPAVAKSVGMVFAMFRVRFCMSSRASPVAPVFFVTMSRPSSTSFQATTDAAPTAAIGAVTFLVSVSPTPFILPPTSLSLSPHSFSCAEWLWICFVTSVRALSYLLMAA